jgi:hypothetical protein
MQGALRDGDHFKVEVLEVREVYLAGRGLWESTTDKFGNTKGGREAQGCRRQPWPRWTLIALHELKFVQNRTASEHGVQ